MATHDGFFSPTGRMTWGQRVIMVVLVGIVCAILLPYAVLFGLLKFFDGKRESLKEWKQNAKRNGALSKVRTG